MTAWRLTHGLQHLRDQIDSWAPDRDHTSDGTIGDTAHQAETSGHNPDDTPGSRPEWDGDPDNTPEVRALDVDSDFRNGADAQALVDHLRRLPGLSSVIRYMIYNRRMYHARDGFSPTPYNGSSPHTEHIHFSGAWTQAADENTTFDYRLEEIPVALTADDKAWIGRAIEEHVMSALIGSTTYPGRDLGALANDIAELRGALTGDQRDGKTITDSAPVRRIIAAADKILAQK